MERLHCTFAFEQHPQLAALGQGALWAGDDLDSWFSQVEAEEAFSVPAGVARLLVLRIAHERV